MTSGHSNKFYKKAWHDRFKTRQMLIAHCSFGDCAYIGRTYDDIAQELRKVNARFVARNIEFA